ncbi:MAG: phenylalanine--tRNA ligase subunit beta [Candidatus Zixiibacteriota bacterium]
MRASYKWLKKLLGNVPEPVELGDILTMTGAEVEKIENWNDKLSDIVCVRVESVERDNPRKGLNKCIVTDGENSYQTLSGAPFIEEGILAAYAKSGGRIAGGVKIKEIEIEGEKSIGMMLSGIEMGFAEPADRLFPIPEGVKPGDDIIELLGWKGEYIYELEITPNRPDLLGHLGLARDIAAALEIDFNPPEFDIPVSKKKTDRKVDIQIENPKACPRYSGMVFENLETGPSPLWLQGLIHSLGTKPISNLVDITNYILMYIPHPMHAFDLEKLESDKIKVRYAEDGEEFLTLDDEKRKLKPEDIVIATDGKAVALGGVMGGLETGITKHTTSILLEAAYFEKRHIRKTSRRLMLMSESSHRFERGMDANRTELALNYAASMIHELAGEDAISGPVLDAYPEKIKPWTLELSPELINKNLGVEIPKERIISILEALELKYLGENPVDAKQIRLKFEIPTYRADLEREIDLVEEIGRIYGYDKLEPVAINMGPLPDDINTIWKMKFQISDKLRGMGILPILGNPIDAFDKVKPFAKEDDIVPIKNPMSEDFTHLRPSLLPSLITSASHNNRQQHESIMFFEFDKVHFYNKKKRPDEKYNLAIALCGVKTPKTWYNTKPESFDIFHIKGLFGDIADFIGFDYRLEAEDVDIFEPGYSMVAYRNKQKIGHFGLLKKQIAKIYDLKAPLFAMELDIKPLLEIFGKDTEIENWSKFPSSQRDIALVMDKSIEAGDVLGFVDKYDSDILKSSRIFDLYTKKPIPKGKKSLGISMIYQAEDRTLTDKEVDKVQDDLVENLCEEFKAEIRE